MEKNRNSLDFLGNDGSYFAMRYCRVDQIKDCTAKFTSHPIVNLGGRSWRLHADCRPPSAGMGSSTTCRLDDKFPTLVAIILPGVTRHLPKPLGHVRVHADLAEGYWEEVVHKLVAIRRGGESAG